MRKIEKLRIEAVISCRLRGHRMTQFSREYRHWWNSSCKDCSLSVLVVDDSSENKTEISGEAVVLRCNKNKRDLP